MKEKSIELREKILALVSEYYNSEHIKNTYKHGDPIKYSGRVYDEHELL